MYLKNSLKMIFYLIVKYIMEVPQIPENFKTIITDFVSDLLITFPEYESRIKKWSSMTNPDDVNELFAYCTTVYPERFFDFLYQNDDIFKTDSKVNTYFLPEVDFKYFYNCENITENTKKSIWRYLQLILFTIVGSLKDKSSFGETSSLFEGIDEDELHSKLQETMSGISDFFTNMSDTMNMGSTEQANDEDDDGCEYTKQPFNFDKMGGIPNMSDFHGHLKGLFDGKIGTLAKEMAEEVSKEIGDILGEDIGDAKSTSDILKKVMKNPKKMMDLIKTVGNKLNTKMKNGEISQEDIMKEASEIMQKMKDMGGNDQFNEMMKNFAKGMGKNVRVDTNAMNNMSKQAKMRERMRERLNEKKMIKNAQNTYKALQATDKPHNYVYKDETEEKQEKSFIKKQQEDADNKLIAELGDISEKTEKNNDKQKKKKNKK